jgi:hypothetical protein
LVVWVTPGSQLRACNTSRLEVEAQTLQCGRDVLTNDFLAGINRQAFAVNR